MPVETPTQPPIIVDPAGAALSPGATQTLRVMQVIGAIAVSSADPAIADATVDQTLRTLTIFGRSVGRTVVTVRDDRGLTRDVAVRVAFPAGSIADAATVRISGEPASQAFVREQALSAAAKRAVLRPGAAILTTADSISVPRPLGVDNVVTVDVPIIIQGGDTYLTVQGTTHVRVENVAVPRVRPSKLLVSDYPETLRENGVLFTADITRGAAQRFLYYHFNPAGQPGRRIVLKAENLSSQPAIVQYIAGAAGPGVNEMEVGHLSTQRFLVRQVQNEGTVVVLPPNSTTTIVDQRLPARNVVSGLMQLNEVEGAPLHLTLIAQNEGDPVDGPVVASALLTGDHPHARGIYSIPEFFFDYSYNTDGPDLEVPIGQIPLPNLVQGQALAGDYGVLQQVTVRMSNYDPRNAHNVALYANPRGGRATGTFIVDGVLVQAHAMAPFGHYKLRQYTLPPGGFVRTVIVTMPEGGSSYPLRLIVAADDGSAAPGSSDSPIY
ncbi:MAG: pilus assembly protein N-terminal domain-containing protein [Candidatus Eremiobacteraeota bacterium]|nr:pilus assembly protein N-terminal domain-containing protein [Candidatus Eremiobacteraeota bacterium]